MDAVELCAYRLLLSKNIPGDPDQNPTSIANKLRPFLSNRTLRNYKNLLSKYLKYCQENKLTKFHEPSVAIEYIRNGIKTNKWSVRYAKMLTTILSKYVVTGEPLKFFEIKKKSYNVVPNKFDTQSFSAMQISAMLESIVFKKDYDDLFLLLVVMDGTGLRFVETQQLTVSNVKALLKGESVQIISAKTNTVNQIKILPIYKSGGDFKLSDGRSVGDVCLKKIRDGITIKDSFNKTIVLQPNDKLFFKRYDSYRTRFKPLKDAIISIGNGTFNNTRQSTRGSNFHAFRRHFATHLHSCLNNTNSLVQQSVVARGLRHNGLGSVRNYLQPNEQEIEDNFESIF